jgi:hypothetical protein
MKKFNIIQKILIIIITFIIAFFVNIGWFFDVCARRLCPDSYGTMPLISSHPNFYLPQRCGGLTGSCVAAQMSLPFFVFDLVLWVLINVVLFLIINRVSDRAKPQVN